MRAVGLRENGVMMTKMISKFLGVVALVGAVGPAGAAPTALVSAAAAQGTSAVEQLTVRELAGTWVEPLTSSNEDGVITEGSENIVQIKPDGQFSDALEIRFTFSAMPEFDGAYRFTSQGQISLASGIITWRVDSAKVVPVYPAGAASEKRVAMDYLATEMQRGMLESESYPIVSYDGNQLLMDAGTDGYYQEYLMTRR